MNNLYLISLILGMLEGLTEFLPISSTGHLIIAADMLNFTGEKAKSFEIFIQLGAICAICWFYRQRLLNVFTGIFRKENAAIRFTLNLFLAFIPAAIIGLALHKFIKAHLFSPFTVACALMVGGLIILVVERFKGQPRIHQVDEMRWNDALKIGFAQAFALFPGTSRSGATIVGSLILGLSRQAATEFSFFLSIPTMFAATGYDLYKSRSLLATDDMGLFAVGFTAAFICGFIAVKSLLGYIAHHDFKVFAYYRIILGIIVFCYFW